MKPRCAIFQANWPVQSHTFNLAASLAKAGFGVDLFIHDCVSYVDLGALSRWPDIVVHDVVAHDTAEPSAASEPDPLFSVLPRSLLSAARLGPGTACLIGVEKHGLVWAGALSRTLGIPLYYLNLELYGEDFERLHRSTDATFQALRRAERVYHRAARATIVQDRDRAEVLLRDNRVDADTTEVFYLPCGSLGASRRERSTYLQDVLGLPRDIEIILYFGQLHEDRYSIALAEAAQQFPPDWLMVLHGWGPERTIDRIRAVDRRSRVRLSLELDHPERILDIVASATVGLAPYAPAPLNDQLTALASEKMAFYAQCGVPFVAFDYPSYRRVLEHDRWGVLVDDLRDLPGAVATILGDLDSYRGAAFRAFGRYYDFERLFRPIAEAISRLPPRSIDSGPGPESSPERAAPASPLLGFHPPPWTRARS